MRVYSLRVDGKEKKKKAPLQQKDTAEKKQNRMAGVLKREPASPPQLVIEVFPP